jgi:hypothetical protein
MCFFGGGSSQPRVAEYESRNDPPVITGEQTGVENPIDTQRASDELKIQREREEGRYEDPSIATAEKLTETKRGGRGMTMAEKAARKNRQTKAKNLAHARMKSKFKSSPTGRKTGVA